MRKVILIMLAVALLGCGKQEQPRMEEECRYAADKTQFAFWSDKAEAMEVRLYTLSRKDSVQDQVKYELTETISLEKSAGDYWRAEIKGDLEGQYYTVRSKQAGVWGEESPGIFAKAVNVNGKKGAIIDMEGTNPEGWETDVRPAMTDRTDIVVYETHLRDFTMSPYSGISPEHRGKFAALTEEETDVYDEGWRLWTGITHLQELGITHLQLLPMFDYGSIDETATLTDRYADSVQHTDIKVYNWGYDPVNYNVPEGSYATDPYDPACRIREAKEMIQALHKAGIRVVMDVVYNHTYDAMGCALGRVVPYYFYRMNEDGTFANGSGCGNETASEKAMMRRFMVESVCYWAREYHIDGFRFDLMGIHDQETMRQIRAALDAIDPTILTYGEGWAAMAPAYPYEELAMKQWTYKMPRVGAFSDDIRNALIGSPFDHERGFASGKAECKQAVMNGLIACPEWSGEPMQHVSYITCHDNYCLRDRIAVSAGEESEETQLRMNKLAQTAVLVSQGMSFLYGGEELYRTKQGIDNSFESPDSINIIPWENKSKYNDLFEYYRQMIQIRRQHKGLRLGTAELVKKHVKFDETDNEHLIIYRIEDLEGMDVAKELIVVLNGGDKSVNIDIDEGKYIILAQDGEAKAEGLATFYGGVMPVAAYSATILIEK